MYSLALKLHSLKHIDLNNIEFTVHKKISEINEKSNTALQIL